MKSTEHVSTLRQAKGRNEPFIIAQVCVRAFRLVDRTSTGSVRARQAP